MDIRNFRVQRAKHPRTFERLLIKERRKPRFPKVGARSNFRVQRAKHPRTMEIVRVNPKVGARSNFRVQS